MKTALEQLIGKWEAMDKSEMTLSERRVYEDVIEQAKFMLDVEKEQIIKAVDDTFDSTINLDFGIMPTPIDGEDYYNYIYKPLLCQHPNKSQH